MNYYTLDFSYDTNSILKILSEYPDRTVQSLRSKELIEINKILRIPHLIVSVLYFQLPPNFIGYIHKDVDLTFGNNKVFALNLPLQNCNNVFMHWFKQIKGTESVVFPGITNETGEVPWLDLENGIKIDSVICNRPNLVKRDDWHSVDSYDAADSKFISVRFTSRVTMNDVKASLEN